MQSFELVSVAVEYINKKKAQDQIYLRVNVMRNTEYYVYKVLVPLILIFVLIWKKVVIAIDIK